MSYHVHYEKEAQKVLKKMDKYEAAIVLRWIEEHLIDSHDPRAHGKGLTGNKSGFWRYHVGAYRIIADICDEEITILLLNIGHRREIYK